ncbi:hypothetical protein HY008_03180 [Candidatus Woesebacteria bacterium]|nr:hypothetical protein [Candidatus Woesebacteria bacterium]
MTINETSNTLVTVSNEGSVNHTSNTVVNAGNNSASKNTGNGTAIGGDVTLMHNVMTKLNSIVIKIWQ